MSASELVNKRIVCNDAVCNFDVGKDDLSPTRPKGCSRLAQTPIKVNKRDRREGPEDSSSKDQVY